MSYITVFILGILTGAWLLHYAGLKGWLEYIGPREGERHD